MFSRRTLMILTGIIGIYIIVVVPGIILNYYDFGKPYTGFFPIIFINKPIAIFLSSGLSLVTETGSCSPIAYCSVTITGWLLLFLFWFLLAWALAWLSSMLLNKYHQTRNLAQHENDKA
jgi:hypothetical protein